MAKTYADIWDANAVELQKQYRPLASDRLELIHRVHAITMRRLANSPGWWEDDDSLADVQKLSLQDVKRDFEEHGLKGMVERWAIRKGIELIIVILTTYLRDMDRESADGENVGAAESNGRMESWAVEADLVLQQQ
jgi:hypothetical protein